MVDLCSIEGCSSVLVFHRKFVLIPDIFLHNLLHPDDRFAEQYALEYIDSMLIEVTSRLRQPTHSIVVVILEGTRCTRLKLNILGSVYFIVDLKFKNPLGKGSAPVSLVLISVQLPLAGTSLVFVSLTFSKRLIDSAGCSQALTLQGRNTAM